LPGAKVFIYWSAPKYKGGGKERSSHLIRLSFGDKLTKTIIGLSFVKGNATNDTSLKAQANNIEGETKFKSQMAAAGY